MRFFIFMASYELAERVFFNSCKLTKRVTKKQAFGTIRSPISSKARFLGTALVQYYETVYSIFRLIVTNTACKEKPFVIK